MWFDYSVFFSSAFALSMAAYLCLTGAIVFLWFKRDPQLWGPIFLLGLIFAFLDGRIELMALGFILLYAAVAYCSFRLKNRFVATFSRIALFALSILLFLHRVPGFSNWKIIDAAHISPDAIPFRMYLNFDKGLIALFILGFGTLPLLKTRKQWAGMFRQTFPMLLIGFPYLALLAIFLHLVVFDVKINNFFIIWALNNLLLVCIAEEVLFRGFLQHYLAKFLKPVPFGGYIAILLAAIGFGLVHVTPCTPSQYFFLMIVAGLFYGWIYKKTQSIEASIFAHFSLNALHYLFFTYPILR